MTCSCGLSMNHPATPGQCPHCDRLCTVKNCGHCAALSVVKNH